VPETRRTLPDFTAWPSFPFEGDLRIKQIQDPVEVEPPRTGEDPNDCTSCAAPDDAYIYVNERWRVRAMDRPTGLPMVLILESRSHLDLGDLPNMLAAELGVMTVRLERAVRSLDGVARVHVNRWGDGSAHLHLWFLARPEGRVQLRGMFLSLWDDILPPIPEEQWRENLALVAAWLAEFGGTPLAQPPRIEWKAPAKLSEQAAAADAAAKSRAAEGRAAEGRAAEGRAAEGRAAEGRAAEGRAAEGRATQDAATQDGVTKGETTEDTAAANAAAAEAPAAVPAGGEPAGPRAPAKRSSDGGAARPGPSGVGPARAGSSPTEAAEPESVPQPAGRPATGR
jgi:diadenosine tetraphosphate (Ap4A) HIT family hydrolase